MLGYMIVELNIDGEGTDAPTGRIFEKYEDAIIVLTHMISIGDEDTKSDFAIKETDGKGDLDPEWFDEDSETLEEIAQEIVDSTAHMVI